MSPRETPSRVPSATTVALLALIAGLLVGVLAARVGGVLRMAVSIVEPIGALWINAVRMTLVPLVVALLVTSVTSFADVRALGRLGARVVMLFLVLLIGVAVFSAVAAPPLLARLRVDPGTVTALRAHATPGPATELPTLRGFVVGLLPTNPVRAAADGTMLPLVVFTLILAVAFTRLPDQSRHLMTGLFRRSATPC